MWSVWIWCPSVEMASLRSWCDSNCMFARWARLATRTFSSLYRFSMRLGTRDWLGYSRTLMCSFLSFCCLGHVFWVILMQKYSSYFLYPGPVHHPFDVVKVSCPLSGKTPQCIKWDVASYSIFLPFATYHASCCHLLINLHGVRR